MRVLICNSNGTYYWVGRNGLVMYLNQNENSEEVSLTEEEAKAKIEEYKNKDGWCVPHIYN